MIPAIFALLSLTLGDGHYKNGFFEHDDPIKIIKHHVEEESWEEEAIDLTKSHIKRMHELKHEGSKDYHELVKIAKVRTGNKEAMDSLLHRILEVEHEQNDNWIDSRFALSRKMASEEFYAIMESAKTLDRIKSENERVKSTTEDKRTAYYEALEQAVNENLEEEKKAKVLKELGEFRQKTLSALDSIDVIKYHRDPRLDNHHATRKELTNFSNEILDYDKKILESYLAFHRVLSAQTTDHQWHVIERSISKHAKSN